MRLGIGGKRDWKLVHGLPYIVRQSRGTGSCRRASACPTSKFQKVTGRRLNSAAITTLTNASGTATRSTSPATAYGADSTVRRVKGPTQEGKPSKAHERARGRRPWGSYREPGRDPAFWFGTRSADPTRTAYESG